MYLSTCPTGRMLRGTAQRGGRVAHRASEGHRGTDLPAVCGKTGGRVPQMVGCQSSWPANGAGVVSYRIRARTRFHSTVGWTSLHSRPCAANGMRLCETFIRDSGRGARRDGYSASRTWVSGPRGQRLSQRAEKTRNFHGAVDGTSGWTRLLTIHEVAASSRLAGRWCMA